MEGFHDIPLGWRVCGENVFAKHSIYYDKLPSYFLVFSIWDENNFSLNWEEVEGLCELLGFYTVPFYIMDFGMRKQSKRVLQGSHNLEVNKRGM
jgi:hypothetical protein